MTAVATRIGTVVRRTGDPDAPGHKIESEIENRLVAKCGRQLRADRFEVTDAPARMCHGCGD